MRTILAILACLSVVAPATAERPRTGWTDKHGFSHYFPLSPEERSRLMTLQQAQRPSADNGTVFVPRPGTSGGSASSFCGWAGCAQGTNTPGGRNIQYTQPQKICGWAGCRQGPATQIQQNYTDVCGWAGCRSGGAAFPAFVGNGTDIGFRDRCGWAGCR